MTQALGRFYRNSLNSGCQVITVREELDIIKSYMTIINIRYNNEISIEYKVDENLLDILLLKLILQPLVENAVHHGMRQKEGKGKLCISVQALDDKLMEVSVRDNGVGIPAVSYTHLLGDTPVPIPNTTVKTQSADGTALETVWESRWAPDQKRKTEFTSDERF